MYADDIVIVAEHWEEWKWPFEECKTLFKKHGLTINLDKTEVMGAVKRRDELNIRMEEKYMNQVKHFVNRGGHISEHGGLMEEWKGVATQNTCRN